MSCQPSPSKSATQTPGPNSSRLIEMPLFPLKCTNLMPAASVTFVNSMRLGRASCAESSEIMHGLLTIKISRRVRTKYLLTGHDRCCLTLAGFGDILVPRCCRLPQDKDKPHFVGKIVVPAHTPGQPTPLFRRHNWKNQRGRMMRIVENCVAGGDKVVREFDLFARIEIRIEARKS